MDFYIKKGSTAPILTLKLVEDGITDVEKFYELLENSKVTFSMINDKGNFVVYKKPCRFAEAKTVPFVMVYQFDEEETAETGTYVATFDITCYNNKNEKLFTLVAPIQEKLYVNVI